MKKRLIFLGIYSALVVSLLFMVPVTAQYSSPVGWSTLPFSDPVDDVYQYTGDSPCDNGEKGDFHGEIDIKTVFTSGPDLIIEFQSTPPTSDNNYQCTIYIDTNNGGEAEYYIAAGVGSGNLFLVRVSDHLYWNGSGWGSMSYLPTSVSGNNLSIQDMDEPIPTFASERYGIVWGYIGADPTLYADYAPNDPSCGIPGYSWLLALFSILTLMGLILYQRKNKAII